MKPHQTLFVLFLIFTLSACTQPTAAPSATPLPPTRTQPAPSATATPIPFTVTPSPTPTLTPTPSATPPPVRLVQWAEWEFDEIFSAAWLPDSQHIVFSSALSPQVAATTYMYNIDSLQLSWQTRAVMYSIAIHPDGNVIAPYTGYAFEFWDALSGETIDGPYEGGNASIIPVFLPDGSALLLGRSWGYTVGGSDTKIDTWDAENSQYIPMIESDGFLFDMAVSYDGDLLVTLLANLLDADGFKYNQVAIWNLATNNQRCAILGDDFTLSPTDKIIAITDHRWIGTEPPIGTPAPQRASRGELTLYDTDTCQPLQTLYQAKYIYHPAYSPDGKIIALASPYGSTSEWILIIDAATGELLWKQTGPWSHIWQLTFSPDGKYLLSIESYGTRDKLHIWQVIPAASP